MCVWVFIYAAFFCIFQSQQSETQNGGRGNSRPLHCEQRTTESAAEICKICSFYRIYGYLCCTLNAIELALNKWQPDTPRNPLPSPFLSHCELHLDDEISAQRALTLPAHSLSISVSICLSVVPFWPSFKTFSVTFSILQFQYAFLMIPIRWNWKTKPTMMQLMKCPGTQMQTGSENYWEYSYAITVAVAIPITVASYSLQSAVSRQAGRQAGKAKYPK